jgi:hypothetical protein
MKRNFRKLAASYQLRGGQLFYVDKSETSKEVVQKSELENLIMDTHSSGAHSPVADAVAKLKEHYYFSGKVNLRKAVEECIGRCEKCHTTGLEKPTSVLQEKEEGDKERDDKEKKETLSFKRQKI